MNISESLSNEFSKRSLPDWEDLVRSQLKIDDISKKTIFNSVEEIDIAALNLKADFHHVISSFPEKINLAVAYRSFFNESLKSLSKDLEIESFYKFDSLIDSSWIHNSGGSAVLELTYILEKFQESLSQKNISIEVSLDSQTYLNIAKIRAIRFMLDSFIQSNNLNNTYQIIGTTSLREQTFFDPWMNMLRAVSSLSSGIMGGVNTFVITSYDYAYCMANKKSPQNLALRNAINMGKILIEESKLDLVKDSMSGSYAIENITKSLIDKTKTKLKENHDSGNTNNKSFYKSESEKTLLKRLELIKKRRYIMSGINDFVNLDEDIVSLYKANHITMEIESVSRLGYDFEKLRLDLSLKQPELNLVNVGELKYLAARSTFCKNYFEVAGIKVNVTNTSIDGLKSLSFDTPVCFCAKDSDIEEVFANTSHLQKDSRTFIAGKSFSKDGYINIFQGQDIFEVLSSLAGEY